MMCLAVPGKVVELDKGTAVVDVMGVRSTVSVELLQGVKEGDFILIHAGCAIAKVSEEEALDTLSLLDELAGLMDRKEDENDEK